MSINSSVNTLGAIQQMYSGDPDLNKRLEALRFKEFKNGHRVVLAKAIADTIDLPPSGIEDFSMWFLTKKLGVTYILDKLSSFIFIENKDEIYKLVKDFAQWRYSMIYNPPHVMCLRGHECIVDEITGIVNFVDPAVLASLCDVYNDVAYMYMTFRILSKSLKGNDQ